MATKFKVNTAYQSLLGSVVVTARSRTRVTVFINATGDTVCVNARMLKRQQLEYIYIYDGITIYSDAVLETDVDLAIAQSGTLPDQASNDLNLVKLASNILSGNTITLDLTPPAKTRFEIGFNYGCYQIIERNGHLLKYQITDDTFQYTVRVFAESGVEVFYLNETFPIYAIGKTKPVDLQKLLAQLRADQAKNI